MGFNKRKMEVQRRRAPPRNRLSGDATDAQNPEDVERLIDAGRRFLPTIGISTSGRCMLPDPSGLPVDMSNERKRAAGFFRTI
jgi:hypothetical protein